MEEFIASLTQFFTDWGYVGLFLSAFVAGSILPFSSEVVLVILVRVGAAFRSVLLGVARLGEQAGGTAFSCLVRSAVIFLLTDYTRTLCEEAGADSLAWCVGLAGRCLVLAAAWPLLEEILQRIGSMTG